MKSFRSEMPAILSPFQIQHRDSLLAMGSCFAAHIGQKLSDLKFPIVRHPFGIVYHPQVLANNLRRIISQKPYTEKDLFLYQDCWHSFDHHGQFSHPDPTICLQNINRVLKTAGASLSGQSTLLLSLGTAWGFQHLEQQRIVANCHKMPAKTFRRFRSDLPEVVEALSQILEILFENHPQMRCIITVSPVRHLRDGLIDNQRSKAVLILAAEELTKKWKQVHYFPAYELLLDDLRDYRFYGSDLLHPSQEAIDYIWSYFSQTYFSADTLALNARIEKLLTASRHRAFHPETVRHQQFLRQQLENIVTLEKEYGYLDFGEERKKLKEQLI